MKPKEVATSEEEGQPTEKSFGAFKQVDGNQATIDLAQLRQHNVFFATPCYGGMLTDQFFLSMFRVSQAFMQHGINFRITTLQALVVRLILGYAFIAAQQVISVLIQTLCILSIVILSLLSFFISGILFINY